MDFYFPHQVGFYKGKVRDVYFLKEQWILMIASNRISAFDVVLPHPIPFKGQVLNQIAAYMLEACKDICPNWLIATPAPNASIGFRCEPFKIEVVVRGNLAGHSWRTYQSGKRNLCGAILPEGLMEYDFLPSPIITPSTKADAGHDEDITLEDIISQNLCSASQWDTIKNYALALFERGKLLAAKQQLILADTKYEFGLLNGEICLMDEIHTPDSSRYFYADGFEERQALSQKQPQLSKEFVREWLIENKFMGRAGDVLPDMNVEWINEISQRYILLYEKLTGNSFHPVHQNDDDLFHTLCEAVEFIVHSAE